MYLSKEGLLEFKNDVDEKDCPNVVLSVSRDELIEFMPDRSIDAVKENTRSELFKEFFGITPKEDLEKQIKGLVSSSLYAFAELVKEVISDSKTISLVYHDSENKNLDKIKNILLANSPLVKEKAALWLFYKLFIYQIPQVDKFDSDYEFRAAASCFELTLERISAYSGRQEFLQPLALTRIILSQYKGGSVYNPFAGVASYHTAMSYGLRRESEFLHYDEPTMGENSLGDSYYGEEINELTWAIGKLRLMFYHMDSSNYILGDSIKEFEGKIDNILTTPPFNLQIINENGDKEYADHFVLRRGVEILSDNGMMAIVVPVSFFSRKDTFDIRKDIVDRHTLTCIVYLPEYLFSSTRISTAIIFIDKKSQRKKLKFVDATSRSASIYGLNVSAISNLIEHDSYPEREGYFTFGESGFCDELTPSIFNTCVCFEDYSNITANEYDLSPSNYLSSYIDVPEGFKLVRLKDLVSTKELSKVSKEGTGVLVNTSDLSKDVRLPYIERVNLKAGLFSQNYKLLDIDEKALLLSSIGDFKPSILGPLYGEVYISPNILAFFLDDSKVDPEYLVSEISKDYVKEQLRLKTLSRVIHRIKLTDALDLQILVPIGNDFLKKEKSIIQELKNEYLEKIGVELVNLKDRRHDEYVKMLRQRKHRLQQIMNEFSPAFSMLNQLRKENGGVLRDSDIVAARTGKVVGEYFDKLESIVVKLEDLVTNLIDKEMWKEPKPVDLVQFINSIPKSHVSDRYVFQIEDNYCPGLTSYGILPYYSSSEVLIAPDDLSTVFDNIINNAIKYGFTDSIRKDYAIRIYLLSDVIDNKPCVNIYVSNNGNPIHPSLDRKRFFDWGYGSNTGIGTWQIKSIVEHYGGQVTLNENPDEVAGFQTELIISLPLIDKEIWR